MSVVIVIAVGVAFLVTFVGTLLVFPAMWWGFRDQWRRFSPKRRRRGLLGGAASAVLVLAAMTLAIAQPWGHDTLVYVIGIGGGSLMLLSLVVGGVQAVRESRQANRRRHERS